MSNADHEGRDGARGATDALGGSASSYPRELELVAHYDANPEYYSAEPSHAFSHFPAFAPGQVLDLGCGDGRLLHTLVRMHRHAGRALGRYLGIDYSKVRIDRARAALQALELPAGVEAKFEFGNAHDHLDGLIAQQRRFDTTFMFEFLEHLEAPTTLMRKVAQVSRRIMGSVPLRHPYPAHLQVYETIDEVVERVTSDRAIFCLDHGHVFFIVNCQLWLQRMGA